MKCTQCQSEWNTSVVLATCPFCGADLQPRAEEKPDSMESVLKTIIDHCGPDALKDGRRTLAMFSDLAPDLKKEKTMFSYLLQCDGHAVLLEALTKPRPQQIAVRAVLIQRMTDDLLLSEAIATQACDGFWTAIGGQTFEAAPTPKPEPKKPASKPAKPASAPKSKQSVPSSGDKYMSLLSRLPDHMVVSGYKYIAALDVKGRVHVTGENTKRVQAAEQWQNIIALDGGFAHLVGLKADGTVCATGHNYQRACETSKWTGIIDIAAGLDFTMGLRPNGTVVYTGKTEWLDELSNWKNIVSIAAGDCHAVGLKADGTVVAAGINEYERCDVSHWTRIARIYTSDYCTFGIMQDGSPVCTDNAFELSHWSDPLHISGGYSHTVGLTRSGQVLECHYEDEDLTDDPDLPCTHITHWKDILTLLAYEEYTLGLKADGTLVFAGEGSYDLDSWKLFDSLDQLDTWLTAAENSKKKLISTQPEPQSKPRPQLSPKAQALLPQIQDRMIACGSGFVAALDVTGRVHITGKNASKVRDAENWQNIISIAAYYEHLVGLKADGTVCATGMNFDHCCDVSGWSGIIDIAAGMSFTIGLTRDGTVVYTGDDDYRHTFGNFRNIVSIRASDEKAVGLKADGTVTIGGKRPFFSYSDRPAEYDWKQIAWIGMDGYTSYGIKQDGTPVCSSDRLQLPPWKNLVHLCHGFQHVYGLTRSGEILSFETEKPTRPNPVPQWNDILALCRDFGHSTIGLKADGTLIASDADEYDVSGWKLFASLDALDAWINSIIPLEKERAELMQKLAGLGLLFYGKERREIRQRLEQIDAQLHRLPR